ncbi:MAG: IS3 family transposase [Lachnospiraceae bacterium]
MKKYNLQCPIRKANPYRRMAKAMATAYTAPNIVNREFEEHGPRKILLTDITYIINGKAPRCYMSTIIDACTKELLSWVLSESLEIDFVLETVKQLIEKHGTDLSTETLIHSDQGSHYTSIKFIQLLKDNELRQSMSRRANCWDNAPQESFFGHMKDELDLSECYSYEEILNAVRDWTEYYNTERYQWDLARLSPVEYYQYLTTGIYLMLYYFDLFLLNLLITQSIKQNSQTDNNFLYQFIFLFTFVYKYCIIKLNLLGVLNC